MTREGVRTFCFVGKWSWAIDIIFSEFSTELVLITRFLEPPHNSNQKFFTSLSGYSNTVILPRLCVRGRSRRHTVTTLQSSECLVYAFNNNTLDLTVNPVSGQVKVGLCYVIESRAQALHEKLMCRPRRRWLELLNWVKVFLAFNELYALLS